ncbi:MAG: cell division protein ZipA C-terminal FtsZ-binding domain-containing protein [Gammaproteobacteria bacterium]|nr:cell division protein ZipA C-terminal FtsZ-binding domain-containing protein [Gammaproteobacteria bacterium]
MDLLRWVLLLIGIAILVAIYLSGRNSENRLRPKTKSKIHKEPALDAGSLDETLESLDRVVAGKTGVIEDDFVLPDEPKKSLKSKKDRKIKAEKINIKETIEHFDEQKTDSWQAFTGEVKSKIISLHVAALGEATFSGLDLTAIFTARNYKYGKMAIFHEVHGNEIIYSIANMVEPGIFILDDMDELQTPGITLFISLPAPLSATVVFDAMLNEAISLSQELGGQLRDDQHSTLTNQRVTQIQDELREYERQLKLKGVG